jgi:hypothetical protein
MRNHVTTATVLLLGLTQAAFAGGPDLRSKAVAIENVVSDDHKILMIVSGRCEILLSDSAMPKEQGNAKYIATDMRHCVVTILRRDEPGSGYDDWEDHCRKAESLVGKSAWIDLQGCSEFVFKNPIASADETAADYIPKAFRVGIGSCRFVGS